MVTRAQHDVEFIYYFGPHSEAKSFPVLRSSSKFYAYLNAMLTKLSRLFLDDFVEFRWKRDAIGKKQI